MFNDYYKDTNFFKNRLLSLVNLECFLFVKLFQNRLKFDYPIRFLLGTCGLLHSLFFDKKTTRYFVNRSSSPLSNIRMNPTEPLEGFYLTTRSTHTCFPLPLQFHDLALLRLLLLALILSLFGLGHLLIVQLLHLCVCDALQLFKGLVGSLQRGKAGSSVQQ